MHIANPMYSIKDEILEELAEKEREKEYELALKDVVIEQQGKILEEKDKKIEEKDKELDLMLQRIKELESKLNDKK